MRSIKIFVEIKIKLLLSLVKFFNLSKNLINENYKFLGIKIKKN